VKRRFYIFWYRRKEITSQLFVAKRKASRTVMLVRLSSRLFSREK
jgi:hypothetical protein